MEFRTNTFGILLIMFGCVLFGSAFLPMMHNLPVTTKYFGVTLGIVAIFNGIFSLKSSPWANYFKQLVLIIIFGVAASAIVVAVSCVGGALIVGVAFGTNAVLHLGLRNDTAYWTNLWASATLLTAMTLFCFFIVRETFERTKRPR